jgi:hypothetical protein
LTWEWACLKAKRSGNLALYASLAASLKRAVKIDSSPAAPAS